MIDQLQIEHKREDYPNAKLLIAYYIAPNDKVEIVRLRESLGVNREKWTVSSHLSRTTAEWAKSFDAHGPALSEYYRRIHRFLDYKFPTLFENYQEQTDE